jgi:transglutaminase-like putative cysteine protease
MTARAVSLTEALLDEETPLRRFWPAEGWIAIVAAIGLPLAVAWSLDDAAWLSGRAGSTSYLPYVAVASVLVGVVLAKLGLGRFRAYLAGSAIGGLVIPFVAGNVLLGDSAPQGLDLNAILARYETVLGVCQRVWTDLVVNGQPFTTEFGHYHLVFGAMVWAAGLLTATAAIGRHRPVDAIVVTGLVLLVNQALTEHEQLQILVFFTIAALVLLIRSHVFEEQLAWARRRIGDPGSVSGLYGQSGTTFVAGAVIGALLLMTTATSSPLQGVWTDLPSRLADVSRWLERFAPPGGDPRPQGLVGFLPNATTTGLWAPDESKVAFVAEVPPDAPSFRWRAGAYADYTLFGWSWGATTELPTDPGVMILDGTGDDPTALISRTDIKITVEPGSFVDPTALSPDTIGAVDRPTTLFGVGPRHRFTTVRLSGGSSPYTVDALIPNVGDTATGLTENRLRAAGRTYPSDISNIYLKLPDGAIGPAAQAILDDVEAQLGGKDKAEAQPYDLARALEAYLRDPANFQYQTDVRAARDRECSGISSVECFARIRAGYCEYYASTMAVLLREARIPARIAYGFLPGDRTASGVETVPASAAHWWVEVYFPNAGWVEFDPTGSVGQPVPLPSGAPVTPPPSAGSFAPRETELLPPRGSIPPGGGGSGSTTNGGSGPLGVVAVLLALAVIVAAVAVARRRTIAQPMHPDTAWGGLGSLAARFGFGPRPAQTVYEYAGSLGEVVPTARVEVGTVARAKVEVAYGHHELSPERLRSVGEAYRRLRLAVLRAGIARRLPRWRR